MSQQLVQEIVQGLDRLPDDEQRRVLQLVLTLASVAPVGVPGRELTRLAGLIEADDLAMMARAIEEGCEQVDEHDW